MAPTHGFTIKIQTKDGKTDIACFSSARKTPELLGILKEFASKQRKFEKLQSRIYLARQRLAAMSNIEADMEEDLADDEKYRAIVAKIDTAQSDLDALIDEQDKLNVDLCDLMWQFYKKGFMGAGYPEEIADQYASTCDPNDLPMIRDRCMTGCGVVDFTKRDTL